MAEVSSTEMHTESSPNAPNIGQVVAIQRPDYVPEKFYDAKTGVINFEAMAKGYGELERKQSAAPAPEKEAPAPTEGEETPAPATKPIEITPIPGVAPDALKEYTAELQTKGALSEKSYESLAKAGYSKPMVDAYVKGLTSDAVVQESVQAARIADEQISEIVASIGGKAELGTMQKWATTGGMTDKQLAAYNAAVSSKDVEVVRLAVAGLKHSFTQANGTGENLLSGNNGGADAGDVFESRAQQTQAINDPRYKTDPAYRAAVAAKIGRSQV